MLLIRDPGGMALIFIMPLALVIVMALVQDAPFRDYQEIKLDVLLVDQDGDSLSAKVKEAFKASPNVNLIVKTDTAEATKLVQFRRIQSCHHYSTAFQRNTAQKNQTIDHRQFFQISDCLPIKVILLHCPSFN